MSLVKENAQAKFWPHLHWLLPIMRLHVVFLTVLIGHAASKPDKCQSICDVKVPQKLGTNCVFVAVCWMPLSKCEEDITNCYAKDEGRTEKIEPCDGKPNLCTRK
ncbi:uncharacterized protein LOC111081581 [Drosophila obscura]|uniref:uncharacterized protein LOC111081581 n=1 Tax=Drosophila obscura TaxID=7282 RepID=UPI001BB29FA9|nr:uncharacterized protein LOC111081581 [Drosophila obscura]